MQKISLVLLVMLLACTAVKKESEISNDKIKLITLDPGHFHAALIQKSMYPDVDSTVHIYAPDSPDLQLHIDKINGYNSRAEDPTAWQTKTYKGQDFFDKMVAEKPGNVVVLAGNNQKKTSYILKSIEGGFNVFADKPMVINAADYPQLEKAFALAKEKNLLLYDIMTERSEITTVLQKELSQIPALFGELAIGSPENPAVTKESVHHYFKYVSGAPLVRPAWFFDTQQQGEGIVDVTTHLVDLTFWECFPEKIIDKKDIALVSAKRWATEISKDDFAKVTGLKDFPEFLKPAVENNQLSAYANGEINFTLKGHHAKVSVIWNYQAPEGTGDTHFSTMRGTKASISIKQGKEQAYKPTLYIEPQAELTSEQLNDYAAAVLKKYPGVSFKQSGKTWLVEIPEKYKDGHEAHFAEVARRYLAYLKDKNLPDWETPNMLTKYWLTTSALTLAQKP